MSEAWSTPATVLRAVASKLDSQWELVGRLVAALARLRSLVHFEGHDTPERAEAIQEANIVLARFGHPTGDEVDSLRPQYLAVNAGGGYAAWKRVGRCVERIGSLIDAPDADEAYRAILEDIGVQGQTVFIDPEDGDEISPGFFDRCFPAAKAESRKDVPR